MIAFTKLGVMVSACVLLLATTALAAADTPPHIDTTRPHDQLYPETSQRAGEQGSIVLQILVETNGKPARVTLAKSSGFANLDNAAVQSAYNWRYIPATKAGDAVSGWTTLQIVYKLPEQAAGN